jgi:hypothetical protein
MKHQRFSSNLAAILLFVGLAACNAPGMNLASTWTPTPAITLEPTAVSVIGITPIPLPTTVPNQADLINKATTNHPVDFVIDTQQLKRGVVPPRFMVLDTWYKYTSPDGAFSVLMHGGVAPKETISNDQQGKFPPGVKVVRADYLTQDNQAVTYFENPALISGELTPEQFLNSFDFAQALRPAAEVEVISDKRVQLNGFPGRDVSLQATLKDESDLKVELYMHIRFYVVGNTVYQLTYADIGTASSDTEARFLNSFTVHDAAP